jgi:hypothetical protein
MPSPNRDFLFYPWGFTAHALPQDACFVGAWPPEIVLQGLCSTDRLSPALATTSPGHPYASTILGATLVQE